MASLSSHLLFSFSLSFFFFFHVQTSPLVIPVSKDPSTLQYLSTIFHGAPASPLPLVLDLGGPFLWLHCESRSSSLSSRRVSSRSIQCLRVPDRRSRGGACGVLAGNPIGELEADGELVEDTVAVGSLDRSITAEIPAVHSCAPRFLLRGLAISAAGILGLGRTQISLPAQISTELGLPRRFSLCLSPSNGVVFSGHHDAVFGPQLSSSLSYTPLLGSQSPEYFINVRAIKVAGIRLPLNQSLLTLDGNSGGTRLSTTVPYTTVETSIFAAVTTAFRESAAAMGIKEASPVAPFAVCFRSESMEATAGGPKAPEIELVLQSEMVGWRINGRNAMVKATEEIECLGVVDGGSRPRNSIVVGGHQMEDILMSFDTGTSMLGFSSSLLQKGRSCSEFLPEKSPEETVLLKSG